MLHHRRRPLLLSTLVAVGLVASFGLSSCSSDGSDAKAPTKEADSSATQPDGDDTGGDAATGEAGGSGGTARITIGDETWEFEQVNCGFGEEETGVEGAVFNMAASKDRISLYAADEPDRAYLELADLDTADDGGLNWTTVGDPVFEVDGRQLSGTFDVVHMGDDGSQDEATAVFEADCG